ncbi:uncharacterized protein [Argopecten irradians]|uniref:uncharacterized protein isoform X2 n=1 Tax=Argopecten irradians TaxID=31199 RepID=UPI003720AAD0
MKPCQAIAVRSCTTHACGIDEMCVGASSDSTCVKHGRTVVKCPKSSVRRGNSCYKLFNIKIGWYEAKYFCHKEGAMLVEIHSGDIGVYLAGIVSFLGGAIGELITLD